MSDALNDLLTLMARLRDPIYGCPWDVQQSFSTIAPYTVEEAYEVAEAIAKNDWENLEEELGDLLFQVVFHSRMAEEKKLFSFENVAKKCVDKMLYRHPHVFSNGKLNAAPVAIKNRGDMPDWDQLKKLEKSAENNQKVQSVLEGVSTGLPALVRALKLQKKAAKVGFDWNDPKAVIAKLREELDELEAEITQKDKKAQEAELGDLLFCVVNLARHLSLDCDQALRLTNAKFERRFAVVEAGLAQQGLSFEEASLAQMEALWVKAKQQE